MPSSWSYLLTQMHCYKFHPKLHIRYRMCWLVLVAYLCWDLYEVVYLCDSCSLAVNDLPWALPDQKTKYHIYVVFKLGVWPHTWTTLYCHRCSSKGIQCSVTIIHPRPTASLVNLAHSVSSSCFWYAVPGKLVAGSQHASPSTTGNQHICYLSTPSGIQYIHIIVCKLTQIYWQWWLQNILTD